MHWTVPKYSKNKVNRAGEVILHPYPPYDNLENDRRFNAMSDDVLRYLEALSIVNNWRSSHNFPLNTFHVGLKRRCKQIDSGSFTAQRIKRLSSIELKLRRFPAMTLSQMQDIGGCRAIVTTCSHVKQLAQAYTESEIKHALVQKDAAFWRTR
jgi:ppGpp synthetase/RelA/SpoT-type nucleotidyltranferase